VGEAIGHSCLTPVVDAKAPGRINLIGEHVDYMGGFVLPAALPMACRVIVFSRTGVELAPLTVVVANSAHTALDMSLMVLPSSPDGAVIAQEKALPTFVTAALIEAAKLIEAQYDVKGAYRTLTEALEAASSVIYVHGTVPLGAGLSSSAALCVSLLFAFVRYAAQLSNVVIEQTWSPATLVALSQAARRIENAYCGVQCGIMDQFVSVHAVSGSFLCLDCDTLQYQAHSIASALGQDYAFLLVNSMHTHALGDAYNRIRGSIEAGQRKVGVFLKDDAFLFCRSVAAWLRSPKEAVNPLQALHDCRGEDLITETEYHCSSYVVEEMVRTAAFIDTVGQMSRRELSQSEGIKKLGALLSETHFGLSKKLCVSTDELDFIQGRLCSGSQPKALGGRLMGGGFGGCCLVLMERAKMESAIKDVTAAFSDRFGVPCDTFVVNELGQGATSAAL
jgi:galactokinase